MSKLKLTTLANQDDSASVPADTIVSGTAKAWVNFNGTGTVAIRRAFNVSSITDNGTGQYTVNFTTAMVDANYSTVLGAQESTANDNLYRRYTSIDTQATNSVKVLSHQDTGGSVDVQGIHVSIFS